MAESGGTVSFYDHFWSSAYRDVAIGIGTDPTKNVWGTLLLYVSLEADLTDKERFPDRWNGQPVTYRATSRPQAYGSQSGRGVEP